VLVRRFPYAVFYRIDPDAIRLVAVLHCRMDPGILNDRR
jgi:plasmid stabilization system protein ParE